MTVDFELRGTPFVALNGGPQYELTPAVSFMVSCEDQADIDRFWEAFLDGGTPSQCGWITDRYGDHLAGRPRPPLGLDRRPGRGRSQPCDAGHAAHGQARHPCPEGRLRRHLGRVTCGG